MLLDIPSDRKNSEAQVDYTREDLIALTNSHIDGLRDLIKDLPDSYVTFAPLDPDAHDPYADDPGDNELAWTLGHVVLHIIASSEEGAARGSTLARGVDLPGRSRYEVPWQSVTTIVELLRLLEDNRRMRLALLDTWPDPPHLDNFYSDERYIRRLGHVNAVGMTLGGLRHEAGHFPQIEEIIRQAREAS